MPTALLVSLACLLAGCARYEYQLTEPPALTRHIGQSVQADVPDDPLVYHLQTVENRLVMWIENPTPDPILLLGDQSQLIDPDGGSHPLKNQTIPPNGFIKLILPPDQTFRSQGDQAFVDSETDIDRQRQMAVVNPQLQPPELGARPAYSDNDDNDALYFRWEGEGTVHLNLTFQRNGRTFQQTLVFHRQKVG